MSNQESSTEAKRVLLLEGANDFHTIRHILEQNKGSIAFDPDEIEYRDMKGFPELLKAIDNAIDSYTTVGMVADANSEPQSRWEDMVKRLAESGIQPPQHPDPQGTVIPAGNRSPKVGVWLMPDNGSPGELEDFIYAMIPQTGPLEDRVWPLAQAYIDGIPEGVRKFDSAIPAKIRKAEVHAWLAARKNPGLIGDGYRRWRPRHRWRALSTLDRVASAALRLIPPPGAGACAPSLVKVPRRLGGEGRRAHTQHGIAGGCDEAGRQGRCGDRGDPGHRAGHR